MRGWRLFGGVLVLAVVGLAIPAVRHWREVPPPPPPVLRLAFDPPPDAELGSGDEVLDAAISPDQRQIVFVATSSGSTMLWRRALDADDTQPLKGTEGARLPTWSPAGDALAFFADGHLRTVTLRDNAITDLAEAPTPAGAAWLPDGSILFAPRQDGVLRRYRDGQATDATARRGRDRGHVFPMGTGIGAEFVYTAIDDGGRRTVRLVREGNERDLAATAGHGQVVGDRVLVVRDGVLLAERLEEAAGRPRDRATTIATGVGVGPGGRGSFVASPRVLLSSAVTLRRREAAWFETTGSRIGAVGEPGDFWQVRLSPDDGDVALTIVAPLLRTLDIAVAPANAAGSLEPLTLALAADSDPVWSPAGDSVLFRSLQNGRPALFTRRAHDADSPVDQALDADATATDWRGSTIVYQTSGETSASDIWSLDLDTRVRTPLVTSGFNQTDGRYSPDGDWLAYVSDESGLPDIYASRRSGGRVRVSFAGGTRPRWARDGRSLFFMRGATIVRATLLESSPPRFAPAVAVLDVPGARDFDVARRRDALLVLAPVNAAASAPVSAVVDWQSMLADGQP